MHADKLANVGAPISNQRLVIQLIVGVNENYDSVATILQQSTPLPSFYEARSRLILEETRKAKQGVTAAGTTDTALLITNSSDNSRSSHFGYGHTLHRHNNCQKMGQTCNSHKGKYNGRRGRGCTGNHQSGGDSNSHGDRNSHQNHQPHQNRQQHGWSQQPLWAAYPPWAG